MERWPHQVAGLESIKQARLDGFRRICLKADTGLGKSLMMADTILSDLEADRRSTIYTNRRLLIEQLSRYFNSQGIYHGIRAADYTPDFNRMVQISSIQTEYARCVKSQRWEINKSDVVHVDEAHIQKSEMMAAIQKAHDGAVIIGWTATPCGLGEFYDKLIVAGSKKEGRACGALVYAKHFAPNEPDMRGFKTCVKTGEYREGDVVKAIMTKNIFGSVWDNWKARNQDVKPTILFAPGVPQSIWFAEQFKAKGVRSAHIDGENCWVDGELYAGSKEARQQILSDVRGGRIPIVNSRYCLREGVDMPELEVGIFATVMGSLQTYLQSGGRLLRACSKTGKKNCTIIDHGGNYHRHGSLNVDREWRLDVTERMMIDERIDSLKEKKEKEPIRCPKCSAIRMGGEICIECGYRSNKNVRIVIQQDGELVEHEGDVYHPRYVHFQDDTLKNWKSCYYSAKNSGRTFKQALAAFNWKFNYYPPSDLPLMPLRSVDLHKKVADVPRDMLVSEHQYNEPPTEQYGQLFVE